MVIRKRIISFALIVLVIFSIVLTSCNTAKDEPEEINYDFSIFFGNLEDAIEIDAMLTEYEKNNGVKINPVLISDSKDNKGTLESLLKDENPPAAYAVAEDIDINVLSEAGYVADFKSIDKNIKNENNSFPYILEGYGLAYDRSMIEEIFGEKYSASLINNLKTATYEEWTVFVKTLDDYINKKSEGSFSIGNTSYKFPESHGESTKNLNGVFAIPGADSSIYGDALLDIIAQSIDISTWEAVKEEPSGSALQVLDPTLTTYVNELDLLTSYLSGEYDSAIRGSDFTNEDYYSIEKTDEIFMEGKAMFAIVDSSKYSQLAKLNAEKAEHLEYLPIKMPYQSGNNALTSEGAVLNNSIPAGVTYSFYINGQSSPEVQKQALDFLTWFMDQEENWGNPLTTSVKEYIESGNTLNNSYESEELDNWKEKVFDENGFKQYLRKEFWSDEYKVEIKTYLMEMWCED